MKPTTKIFHRFEMEGSLLVIQQYYLLILPNFKIELPLGTHTVYSEGHRYSGQRWQQNFGEILRQKCFSNCERTTDFRKEPF